MASKVEELERYYDYHAREDEEVGQGYYHQAAIEYLVLVLKWLFYAQVVGVGNSINVYHERVDPKKAPSPDIAVIDGVAIDDRPPGQPQSHFVGRDGPAPRIVFEISSDHTWRQDLGVDRQQPLEDQKPALYERMEVAEYICFDPNRPTLWTREWKAEGRLVGWRLNLTSGQYERIEKTTEGWLWSEQLQSFLVVEAGHLRLYTASRERRLTESEALKEQSDAAEQRALAEGRRAMAAQQRADQEQQRAVEAERKANQEQQRAVEAERKANQEQQRANKVQRQADQERLRVEEAERQADQERARANEESRKLAELMEKLRSKGIDPETL